MANLRIRVREARNFKLVVGLAKWLENHMGEFTEETLTALKNNPHARRFNAHKNPKVIEAINNGAEAFLIKEIDPEESELTVIYSLAGLAIGLDLPAGILAKLEIDGLTEWYKAELEERGIFKGVEIGII